MLKALLLAAMLLVGATAYAEDPVTSPGRVQPPPTPVTVVSQPAPPPVDSWTAFRGWVQAVGFPASLAVFGFFWRLHSKVVEQAAINGKVTTSLYGYGAMLAQHVLSHGGSAKDLGINDPVVTSFLDEFFYNYPKDTVTIGMTRQKALGVLKKGAAIAAAPITAAVVAASPPPEKSTAQIAYEANGGLDWPSEPTAMKDHWEAVAAAESEPATTTATAAPSSPVVSSIGLPIHSHGA